MKFVFALFISFTVQAHQNVMTKIVSLNADEPYAPMVFHNGFLWLGRIDASQRKAQHRIEVWSSDGEDLLTSWKVPHSVERLYPFDSERIVILGKAFNKSGWTTYYSLAKSCCGAVTLETHALPQQFQVEEFAKDHNTIYFTEVGDQALVRISEKNTDLLKLNISGPGQIQVLGDTLFILERGSFFWGDENMVKFNPSTLKVERFFPAPRQGLLSPLSINNGSSVAVAEYFSEQVLLLNPQKPGEFQSISLKGTHPSNIASWHRCLIVTSEKPNRISVINLTTRIPQVVAEYDLEFYAADLPNFISMSVNPDSASVFLRSAHLGDWSSTSSNSVYRFTASDWIQACE